MTAIYQVYIGLLVILCVGAWAGSWADIQALWRSFLAISPLRRTATVMAINATVSAGFVVASGIDDPWGWYILMDAAAAAIVLHQPAGKAQSVIGSLFMAQIVVHVVYGVSGAAVSKDAYWQVLIAIAFAQLVVLGGWTIGHHGGRLARHLRLRRRAAVARAESRKGMAG